MQPSKASSEPWHDDMFQGDTLRRIPDISQGEMLYSWCARYHRISGTISATATSQRLFGSKAAGFVVDFPGRIGHFSNVTASILGAPEHLIRNHTLYPLYAAFRPPLTMAKVENLMLGNSVERVKFLLGLPASRAATSHPLKFCPTCAHEELLEFGIARWWREHQWPTIWICRHHQITLQYLQSPNGLHKVTSWLTPDSLHNSTAIYSAVIPDSELPSLERLRRTTSEIVNKAEFLRPEILRLVFILRLRQFGWIKPAGTLDWLTIQNAFLKKFGSLDKLPGFDFVHGIRRDEFGSLGPMLRGRKRLQHPTKYILLIDLLFDTAEQFFDLYSKHESTEEPQTDIQRLKREDADFLDEQLNALVCADGNSLNSAAQKLGISVQRVVHWAKRNNIEYEKRPRKTSKEFQMNLDGLLQVGASRAEISQSLNVSRKWITAYLARHPEQKKKWRAENIAAEISKRRMQLLEILDHYPGANQNQIRSIPGNPFQWLSRNDEAWLKENLPFFNKTLF